MGYHCSYLDLVEQEKGVAMSHILSEVGWEKSVACFVPSCTCLIHVDETFIVLPIDDGLQIVESVLVQAGADKRESIECTLLHIRFA